MLSNNQKHLSQCFVLGLTEFNDVGKFRDAITPRWIKKYLIIYKEQGFKAMLKAAGWKVVVLIFLYYLIRDSFLYIILPYMIAKGILQF